MISDYIVYYIDRIQFWTVRIVSIAFIGWVAIKILNSDLSEAFSAIKEWQTLITGLLAIIAAIVGLYGLNQSTDRQIRAQKISDVEAHVKELQMLASYFDSLTDPRYYRGESRSETFSNLGISIQSFHLQNGHSLDQSGFPNARFATHSLYLMCFYVAKCEIDNRPVPASKLRRMSKYGQRLYQWCDGLLKRDITLDFKKEASDELLISDEADSIGTAYLFQIIDNAEYDAPSPEDQFVDEIATVICENQDDPAAVAKAIYEYLDRTALFKKASDETERQNNRLKKAAAKIISEKEAERGCRHHNHPDEVD